MQNDDGNNETDVPIKRYIYPEVRRQIIGELRLAWQYNAISKNSKFAEQCIKSTI